MKCEHGLKKGLNCVYCENAALTEKVSKLEYNRKYWKGLYEDAHSAYEGRNEVAKALTAKVAELERKNKILDTYHTIFGDKSLTKEMVATFNMIEENERLKAEKESMRIIATRRDALIKRLETDIFNLKNQIAAIKGEVKDREQNTMITMKALRKLEAEKEKLENQLGEKGGVK